MTNKLLFLIILFPFYTACLAQTYSSVISDKDIVDFIHWKLYESPEDSAAKKYFSFSASILKWQKEDLQCYDSMFNTGNNFFCIYNDQNKFLDTILNLNDKKFIVKQSNAGNGSKWLIEKPKNRKAEKGHDYYFSLPLFSVDKKYAMLREVFYCGPRCGGAAIILYKQTETGWFIYSRLQDIVF